MEQYATQTSEVKSSAQSKPTPLSGNLSKVEKSNKTLKIATAIAACVAVVGVGFGIYGMVQAANTPNISDIEVKVKNSDGTTTAISDAAISATQDAGKGTVVTIERELATNSGGNNQLTVPGASEAPANCQTENTPTEVNSGDYIYVGEWGIKIKVPDNLRTVSYLYNAAKNTLYVNGVAYREGGMHYLPEFADVNRNPDGLAAVGSSGSGAFVVNINGIDYTYSGPQAVYSQDAEEQQWESESIQNIKAMLTNPENYSAI